MLLHACIRLSCALLGIAIFSTRRTSLTTFFGSKPQAALSSFAMHILHENVCVQMDGTMLVKAFGFESCPTRLLALACHHIRNLSTSRTPLHCTS
jgi:hypothetical protein